MEQTASRYIRKRSISALILALIFFACCYSINWWEFMGIWSLVFILPIPIIFFWMFYQWIFEVALLIRDRKVLTKIHFIPILIVTLYLTVVISGFLLIFERYPLYTSAAKPVPRYSPWTTSLGNYVMHRQQPLRNVAFFPSSR
jgi:hypothetical protein